MLLNNYYVEQNDVKSPHIFFRMVPYEVYTGGSVPYSFVPPQITK